MNARSVIESLYSAISSSEPLVDGWLPSFVALGTTVLSFAAYPGLQTDPVEAEARLMLLSSVV